MRKPLVGGVSLSTEGDDLGGTVAAQGRHVSVPYPHLPPVSYALSPRRRRTLGAPARRIWPGIIALIGSWRFREHRSVPEMHQRLQARGLAISEQAVTPLMQRYAELVSSRV